jgi:hypothetical protein
MSEQERKQTKNINNLIKQGAPTSVDTKNQQPRQAVATSGKLRIKVGNPK